MKLTQEEKEILKDMAESSVAPVLLKWLDIVVARMERSVINCPVTTGSREITLKKARLEGAQALRTAVDTLKQELKNA